MPDPFHHGNTVFCNGPAAQRRVSYARFVLPIERFGLGYEFETNGLHAADLDFSAVIADAENMQIYGGHSASPSETRLADDAGPVSYINYTDARLESQREMIFVVVGALIALGAAMALECFRPFVEFSARRRSRQGQQ
ncbi:MAG: hypothetical protein JO177_06195 [Candidatus Eremiobacteraeota bacterium]|nr:hypothetical protein [Candidatus Eremiobacteraeota bacterium]